MFLQIITKINSHNDDNYCVEKLQYVSLCDESSDDQSAKVKKNYLPIDPLKIKDNTVYLCAISTQSVGTDYETYSSEYDEEQTISNVFPMRSEVIPKHIKIQQH